MKKPILAAMLSCHSTQLSDEEKRLFADYNPLGISLFGRNINDKEQLKTLIKEIKEVIGRDDVLIAVDQEGGRVRRLQGKEFHDIVSLEKLADIAHSQSLSQAVSAAFKHSQLICHDLQSVGINFNYAPVLDIAYPDTTPALKNRCMGDDENIISTLGRVISDGHIMNHICPCIKHMPGHGRAKVDPHLHLPVISASLKELEKDFYPFQQLNNAPAGMTAHLVLETVDSAPVTLSHKAITEVIRGIIGFQGLLISDAVDMKALSGTMAEKASAALNAGCDVICYCSGDAEEMETVCRACTNLSDKSLIRFAKIKNIVQSESNICTVAEEYYDIVGSAGVYDSEYDATEVLHQMKIKNS